MTTSDYKKQHVIVQQQHETELCQAFDQASASFHDVNYSTQTKLVDGLIEKLSKVSESLLKCNTFLANLASEQYGWFLKSRVMRKIADVEQQKLVNRRMQQRTRHIGYDYFHSILPQPLMHFDGDLMQLIETSDLLPIAENISLDSRVVWLEPRTLFAPGTFRRASSSIRSRVSSYRKRNAFQPLDMRGGSAVTSLFIRSDDIYLEALGISESVLQRSSSEVRRSHEVQTRLILQSERYQALFSNELIFQTCFETFYWNDRHTLPDMPSHKRDYEPVLRILSDVLGKVIGLHYQGASSETGSNSSFTDRNYLKELWSDLPSKKAGFPPEALILPRSGRYGQHGVENFIFCGVEGELLKAVVPNYLLQSRIYHQNGSIRNWVKIHRTRRKLLAIYFASSLLRIAEDSRWRQLIRSFIHIDLSVLISYVCFLGEIQLLELLHRFIQSCRQDGASPAGTETSGNDLRLFIKRHVPNQSLHTLVVRKRILMRRKSGRGISDNHLYFPFCPFATALLSGSYEMAKLLFEQLKIKITDKRFLSFVIMLKNLEPRCEDLIDKLIQEKLGSHRR